MQIILAYLRLVRWVNLLIITLAIYWFYAYIIRPVNIAAIYTSLFTFTELILFILSIVSVAAAGNVINDYFDIEIDRTQRPERPLPSGTISLDAAYTLYFLLNLVGVGLGFYLSWQNNNYRLGYIYIIAALLLYLYSASLKKIAVVGNVVVASLIAVIFLLVFVFEANFVSIIPLDELDKEKALRVIYYQVIGYALFAFFTNFAREVVKDMEDMKGDELHKVKSLPVVAGLNVAKIAAAFITLVVISGLGFVQYIMWHGQAFKQFAYIAVLLQLPLLVSFIFTLKGKQPADFKIVSLLLKVIMFLGIATLPIFYLLNK